MSNIYTIATKHTVYEKLLDIPVAPFLPAYQARPGMHLPVLIKEGDGYAVVSAKWNIQLKGKGRVAELPMRRVLKHREYNLLIRRKRCAIPANCFVIAKGLDAFVIRLLKHRIFWIGGVYQVWENKRGEQFYNFAILKTDPPDVLGNLCDAVPVVIAPDRYKAWIETNEIHRVMEMADRTGNLWFDYFKVNPIILEPGLNDRDLLIPLGNTYQQYKQRDRNFKKISIEELRANSRGRK